jgi:hypothetical protein
MMLRFAEQIYQKAPAAAPAERPLGWLDGAVIANAFANQLLATAQYGKTQAAVEAPNFTGFYRLFVTIRD